VKSIKIPIIIAAQFFRKTKQKKIVVSIPEGLRSRVMTADKNIF
jgi:hypothetical protein